MSSQGTKFLQLIGGWQVALKKALSFPEITKSTRFFPTVPIRVVGSSFQVGATKGKASDGILRVCLYKDAQVWE